ncbi:transcriptional regulator [Actinomyces naeslundii]|uniref:LacI family DNA-binding transcriptional regulator n=1 Tax=Actinomyces naeslundii TaxID=1655 RepID=UPI00094BF301|nr:LacI family DNA-binding transcriptional regulator [Actinomyces naeslundii]OLO93328.1 transcriptional regulator [Actinomyces naeslundii]
MSTRVTLSDVADAVGVSPQTVSRVLNNHPSVRPETRQKVLAAVRALGYEPNLAARSLASGSSGAVGILLTAGLSHGMASTFSAIARAVRERGGTFVLATADGSDSKSVRQALAHLHGYRVAATVVLAQRADVLAVLSSQRRPGPIVAIISGQYDFSTLSTVSINQALGARLATEHLLAQGRTRPLHVTGDLTWQDASERLAAYQSVCAEAGLPGRWVGTDDWTGEAGARVARRLLDSGLPDAIFAGNDDIALGLCHELLAAGVRIPDDVAVIGFDDIPLARWATPSLSSITQDFDALGRAALSLSDELVEGGTPRSVTLTPQLVVRGSTPSRSR